MDKNLYKNNSQKKKTNPQNFQTRSQEHTEDKTGQCDYAKLKSYCAVE